MVADPAVKRRMEETYLAGMRNIVTSPAGDEMLKGCSAGFDAYIPNGIDFSIYKLARGVDSAERLLIGFPTRPEHFKGTEDALRALEIVRSNIGSDLEVWSFGGKCPDYMPDWVAYHERPSDTELCDLYNRSRIFIVPSHYEGWGLPGAEAMACGSALLSTDNVGVRAYAEHGKTALLSQPMDPTSLADNVLRLLRDEALRLQLAWEGHRHIQQFTWERAVTALDSFLRGCR
ncbi:glycosyltransferase family 4 protein [Geotalea uraniireducens]|nr:glycosyltransferase family 4 protein [Geotalea uraniireducens]